MPLRRRNRGVPTSAPESTQPKSPAPARKAVTQRFIDETIVCHGLMMLEIEPGLYWCPSQEHDGRPKSHPLGETPRTPSFRKDHA